MTNCLSSDLRQCFFCIISKKTIPCGGKLRGIVFGSVSVVLFPYPADRVCSLYLIFSFVLSFGVEGLFCQL